VDQGSVHGNLLAGEISWDVQFHHKYTWVDHLARKQTVPGFYATGTMQDRCASCLLPSKKIKESTC
jgi:hypothetical protein